MADVPFELEGPVTAITLVSATEVKMNVMGMIDNMGVIVRGITVTVENSMVRFIPGTTQRETIPVLVKTPTRLITLAELADKTKLDKRTEDGFVNATAIVEGVFDDAATPRVYRVFGVEIEPAENLILGELTDEVNVAVNGVKVHQIIDSRMKFKGPTNEFGFQVLLNATLKQKPASVEGYFAVFANEFCAHLLEVDSSAPVDTSDKRNVTILRSRSRERPGGPATVDFRGGVRMPPGVLNTIVHVYRIDPNPGQEWHKDHDAIVATGSPTFLGELTVTADGAFPAFGLWRLKGPLDATRPINLKPPRFIRVMRMTSTVPPPKVEQDECDTDLRLG